jgi:hypothetical protein
MGSLRYPLTCQVLECIRVPWRSRNNRGGSSAGPNVVINWASSPTRERHHHGVYLHRRRGAARTARSTSLRRLADCARVRLGTWRDRGGRGARRRASARSSSHWNDTDGPRDRAPCRDRIVLPTAIPLAPSNASELGVQPGREDVHRAAVGIIGRVGDELVVEGQPGRVEQGVGVIGLEDALGPVVERTVAD